MKHFWVSFDYVTDENGTLVSPSAWVDAESVEDATRVARGKLKHLLKWDTEMTTCMEFMEEDYKKEMLRRSLYYKSLGRDEKLN